MKINNDSTTRYGPPKKGTQASTPLALPIQPTQRLQEHGCKAVKLQIKDKTIILVGIFHEKNRQFLPQELTEHKDYICQNINHFQSPQTGIFLEIDQKPLSQSDKQKIAENKTVKCLLPLKKLVKATFHYTR